MRFALGIFFLFFMSLQVNIGVLNAEMNVSMSPPSGQVGTTFTNRGSGFTPNSTVTLIRKPADGMEKAIARIKTDPTGSFTVTWTAKTPGSNFAWWVVDDTTEKRSGNEVVYNISTIESPTISQSLETATSIAPQAPITTQDVTKKLQEISHEIQLLRKEMMTGSKHELPEYSPGTSGSVAAAISGGFGSKEYDKHYFDANSYHTTALQQLKQASDFVRKKNTEQAINYLKKAKQSLQKFHEAISTSATAWGSQLAKAKMIAKMVQTAADHSLSSLASLVPGAKPVVDGFLVGRNFYFDTTMYGINEATKKGITRIIISKIFEDILPEGKPVNGLGQIDLRLLAKRLMDDTSLNNRVAEVVFKKLGKEIGINIVKDITNKAADGFAKYLESITPATVTNNKPLENTVQKSDLVHRSGVILSMSTITPSSIKTSSSPYAPTLSLRGSGFSNVTQINFRWAGVVSGSTTWNKRNSRWKKSVRILSDTLINITPQVVEQSPSWSGTLKWTITLRDTRGATASQNFTVTYMPQLTTKTNKPALQSHTLKVNSRAVVSNTYEPGKGYVGLKLRNGPGLNARKKGNLSEGTKVNIKAGPVSKDGYIWWHVKSQGGQEGWCAEDWLATLP